MDRQGYDFIWRHFANTLIHEKATWWNPREDPKLASERLRYHRWECGSYYIESATRWLEKPNPGGWTNTHGCEVIYCDDVFYCVRCESYWEGEFVHLPETGHQIDIERLPAFIEEQRARPEWIERRCRGRFTYRCDSMYRAKVRRLGEERERERLAQRAEVFRREQEICKANILRFKEIADVAHFDRLVAFGFFHGATKENPECPICLNCYYPVLAIRFFYGPLRIEEIILRFASLDWRAICLRVLYSNINRKIKDMRNNITRPRQIDPERLPEPKVEAKIRNMDDLVLRLCELYERTAAGTQDLKAAKELNDTANRIIMALRTQVVYLELQARTDNKITFLETPENNNLLSRANHAENS
jgi:hypothetical protein